MKIIFILLSILITIYADIGNTLKKENNIFDFSYKDNVLERESDDILEKSLIEVQKETILTKRFPNLFSCEYGEKGNAYCPAALSKASEEWSYNESASKKHTVSVIDYAKKSIVKKISYSQPFTGFQTKALGSNKFVDIKYSIALIPTSTWGSTGANFVDLKYDGNYKFSVSWVDSKLLPYNEYRISYFNFPRSVFGDAQEIRIRNGRFEYRSAYDNKWFDAGTEGVKLSKDGMKVRLVSGCPDGSTLVDSKCKTVKEIISCPDGYELTKGSEKQKGECKKIYSYDYYEYLCEKEKNEQNQIFEPVDKGGDCNKKDTDNTKVDNNLGKACNSATPPKNNCKRKEFTCNSNVVKPAFVDGEWKCSPYLCNSNFKCGYASCNELEPSQNFNHKQSNAYNPLGADFNEKCNGRDCGYVMNEVITYCIAHKCPGGVGYSQIGDKCYKKECPKGTYIVNNKCVKSDI